ncbi:MAG: translocation/assembly module TamB domain-containing protein [Vicinamibacterales bacterium]
MLWPARAVRGVVRWSAWAIVALLVLGGIAVGVVETAWAKDQLRALIVRQANQYLTATLSIDDLSGSLLRGLRLSGITLARDGRTLIRIDAVEVSYAIGELFRQGTAVRSISVSHAVVVAARLPDGRWDLGTLIRRTAQEAGQRGPGRPLHLHQIDVTDAEIILESPLTFGIAHLPTHYSALNARFSFDYQPATWRLAFERASWRGQAPTFDVESFAGAITNTPEAWGLESLAVQTPRSRVLVNGTVDRRQAPAVLSLDVRADRFAFQEWGGVVASVANIAVEGPFVATLRGPVKQLDTTLQLSSTGGGVDGRFTLDTTRPGWRAAGRASLQRLDLARWLNKADDASDISGAVTFDINMPPESHFPRGTYAFDGSHARFMGYEADDVVVSGVMTPADVRIAAGTATAYGANVRLDGGRIGIDAPFPFTFNGLVNGIDLRQLPKSVPVPRVESTLRFAFDVGGQFRQGFVRGTAAFQESTFLGVRLGDGARGAIDTSAQPFSYSGEGDLADIDLPRLGAGLDIAWMQEPRYEGQIAGHFRVEGTGGSAAEMRLSGGGRLTEATLFAGALRDGDVSIQIAGGALAGSYDGVLDHVNPALAMDDQRYEAVLVGRGTGRVAVRDLMRRAASLEDYTIDATLDLGPGSEVRGLPLTAGRTTAHLSESTLALQTLEVEGPAIAASGSGRVALDGTRSSDFSYDVRRATLSDFSRLIGRPLGGQLVTKGRLTGTLETPHLVGDGTTTSVEVSGVRALTAQLRYDAEMTSAHPSDSRVSVVGTLGDVAAAGEQFKAITGSASYVAGRTTLDVALTRSAGLQGHLATVAQVDLSARTATLEQADVSVDRSSWRLEASRPLAQVSWDERGIRVDRLVLADAGGGAQRLTADGTWFPEGGGSLHLTAQQVSIDALSTHDTAGGPARYGGTLTADAVLTGSRALPVVAGTVSIVDGRVWRTSYERLEGRLSYLGPDVSLDLRLDQSPGVWLTVSGRVPADVMTIGRASTRPLTLDVHSSRIDLGLLEGLTDVVRNVSGQLQMNVAIVGTPQDPHFKGRLEVDGAAFLVTASGARYRNGRLALNLGADQIAIETLKLDDRGGHSLEVSGALATHELRVGNLKVAVKARDFEVLRNEFGQLNIDSDLTLDGEFERPRLGGRVTVRRGQLEVDSILDRALFRPYSTAAASTPTTPPPDAIVAISPWQQMTIGIELHVPNTLRLSGENIQISPGTPIGIGGINLRALGDLYFYKDVGGPLYVTGSLDSVTGTYAFQGKRFDLDPSSSINFRGDFNPELYVIVEREISSVIARVTIAGPLSGPELRLSSTPPLDQSDILSLIVFNASTNELNAVQQQQLAGRAATIAAGFLAAPILSAIEQSLGLDTLEIVTDATAAGGTRLTIGNEIAPGLVARFSRQFGNDQYDEAAIEYFLSRLFRLRATFSDASSLGTRSPFRRVERAGIDFLIFFSF